MKHLDRSPEISTDGSLKGGGTKYRALATVGLTALLTMSASAMAQETPVPSTRPADAGVVGAATVAEVGPGPTEEIVVTGSRITRSGFNAPTPTTVIGVAEIERSAQPNIFTTINQIPALAGSAATSTGTGSSSAGTNGRSTLNLRGLGANRTLVLIDGQRVIGVDTTGGTDISQFPQGLIQRVDIVTGGASASWGSDAVAGVVNFIIDKKFDGIKGNLNVGETTYGDDRNATIQLTAGTGFADGRGHVEVSGEYSRNGGVGSPLTNRNWYRGWKLIQYPINAVPAGQPQYISSPNVADYLLAPGGIITGRGTSLTSSIVGTTFGQGGTPSNFQYGSLTVSPYMIGGDQRSDEGWGADLDTKLNRATFYGRLSYDITPSTNIWTTFNFARVYTNNVAFYSTYKPGNLTIQCDNPYLPTGIAAACGGAGHSVQFGTMNADLPDIEVQNTRTMRRFAVGGDGKFPVFGHDWKWDVSYTHGENDIVNNNFNQTLTGLYNASIDAVRGANGVITCRSLVAQAQGCRPLNVIGLGVADASAAGYFTGTAWLRTQLQQDAASIAFNGEPFSIWAGPVSVAFGGEYRREAFKQTADACSYTNCGNPLLNAENNWFSGNFHPSKGNFNVKEAFIEVVAPLLKGDATGDMDLDLGGRIADYSSSGRVETWKAGLTYTPPIVEGLKFRGVVSRDIRAPNLNDLFAAASTPTSGVTNRFGATAGQTFIIKQPTLSNRNLTPEIARTIEGGVVYQPAWLRGLSASVDYYRISLKDAIGTISGQQEMDLCFDGNAALCSLITFDANLVPTQVALSKINLASVTTDGFDIEVSYVKRLDDFVAGVPGSVSLRTLATNTMHFTTDPGIPGQPILETAGQNSGSIAKWRVMGVQSYDNERLSFTLTERWFSGGTINNSYIECTSGCPVSTTSRPTINDNHMKGALYLDFGATYNIIKNDDGHRLTAYFKVDNFLNQDPEPSPAFGALPINNGTNPVLYDNLGRRFSVGVRFQY
jgi:iron complex outermembrane receptor protein